MGWVGHVVRIWERRVECNILMGKPEGRKPLCIRRLRWENNIDIDLQMVGCGHGLD